jgi:hypothetical protein
MVKILNSGLDLLPEGNPPTDLSIRYQSRPATAAPPNKACRVGLGILGIWFLTVFCFAALTFCVYIIFAKCEGKWPF